jgi:uncharacterized membrane protein YhdT
MNRSPPTAPERGRFAGDFGINCVGGSMNDERKLERNFWRFWLGGLFILAVMIAMNPWFVSDVSPWGIRDHQSAGNAARIDAIQAAWQAEGAMELARWAIALDLVYIAVYSFGAYCGGRMFRAADTPALQRLGWIIMVAAIIVFVADYIETICQFIQALRFAGDDALAEIAAAAQPIKSAAFLISLFGIITALVVRRRARRSAGG